MENQVNQNVENPWICINQEYCDSMSLMDICSWAEAN